MLVIKKQIRPGVVVLEITDSIRNGPNCQQIERQMDELIRKDEKWVIFDLSRVTYVDSSGIGTIVRTLGRLKKVGGTLRLAGVKEMVEGVLKITQVVKIIEIFPTAADASRDFPPVPNP
ncbi:MAG TPA: STAS domain-containing protein [Terriglobia bacterium]|nr:STAS domain-containing protein [Terriglobia bacterium]